MFGKRKSLSFNTLIGEGTTVHSDISCNGSIRIDGTVYGDITSERDIFLSKSSNVSGDLKGSSIYIAGCLNGNTDSSETVRLFSTCKITGNIQAQKIITDDGAIFTGSFKTIILNT